MGDRIEDFDYTAENFLRHKEQGQVSFDQYFERKSADFAKSFGKTSKIYLDTKFWVKLRNAALGVSTNPVDVNLLSALRKSVVERRAVFPFSSPLWFETFHQSDPNTRVATARLIDELSLRLTSMTEEDRIALEVGDLFDRFVLKKPLSESVENLVWSVPSCGLGIPFIHSKDWQESDAVAMQKTLLDEIWTTEFAGIAASGEDLSAKIKAPLAQMAAEINMFRDTHTPAATFEEEHAREFVGALRSKKRTIAQTVELKLRLHFGAVAPHAPALYEKAATKFSATILEAFLTGKLANALPTLVIPTALHAAFGRDRSRRFRDNDFHDFSHATVALAYCDCFATEKSLGHLIDAQLGFSCRYNTKVITSSEDLIAFVNSLSAPAPA
jgi:hypothetical protein